MSPRTIILGYWILQYFHVYIHVFAYWFTINKLAAVLNVFHRQETGKINVKAVNNQINSHQ